MAVHSFHLTGPKTKTNASMKHFWWFFVWLINIMTTVTKKFILSNDCNFKKYLNNYHTLIEEHSLNWDLKLLNIHANMIIFLNTIILFHQNNPTYQYTGGTSNTDNGRKTYNFLLAVLDYVLCYLVNFVTMVLKLPAQFCVVKDDVWKQP